jgi:hypothetical protein
MQWMPYGKTTIVPILSLVCVKPLTLIPFVARNCQWGTPGALSKLAVNLHVSNLSACFSPSSVFHDRCIQSFGAKLKNLISVPDNAIVVISFRACYQLRLLPHCRIKFKQIPFGSNEHGCTMLGVW